MKTVFAFLSCVLFASTMLAQDAPKTANSNPFLDDKKTTIDTLHNAITKLPYTFLAGGWTMHIRFDKNGTGAEEDWKFKWHARDGNTVELTSPKFPNQKAVLTFSDDYTTYTGFHFGGLKPVSGQQVVPHQ
jgi:hypothetical protein